LPLALFITAYYKLMADLGGLVVQRFEKQPGGAFLHLDTLRKVTLFDVSLMDDAIAFERERLIREQQVAIRELSAPVLQLRDRLLLLPLIGVLDNARARLLTENLLAAIRKSRALIVVIDVTGVPAVDTKVAHLLLQTVSAARLMGSRVIITALSAEVAQS